MWEFNWTADIKVFVNNAIILYWPYTVILHWGANYSMQWYLSSWFEQTMNEYCPTSVRPIFVVSQSYCNDWQVCFYHSYFEENFGQMFSHTSLFHQINLLFLKNVLPQIFIIFLTQSKYHFSDTFVYTSPKM